MLERHHLHSTFHLLSHAHLDIFADFEPVERAAVRQLMIDTILATDLARHFEFITALRALAQKHGHAACAEGSAGSAASSMRCESMDDALSPAGSATERASAAAAVGGAGRAGGAADSGWSSPLADPEVVDVALLLKTAIKWADLGHTTKAGALHRAWTQRVTDEFYTLGDRERALGVALSPMCDRETGSSGSLAKSQIGFFTVRSAPLLAREKGATGSRRGGRGGGGERRGDPIMIVPPSSPTAQWHLAPPSPCCDLRCLLRGLLLTPTGRVLERRASAVCVQAVLCRRRRLGGARDAAMAAAAGEPGRMALGV